jgi:hypothetical protein
MDAFRGIRFSLDCRLNIGRLINATISIEWHEVMQEIVQ